MNQKKNKVISIVSREATLKRKLRRHLHTLGFRKTKDGALQIEGSGKDVIRKLHAHQRTERLNNSKDFLATKAHTLLEYFASGSDIDPSKISPVLEHVAAQTWQGDLFRLASLTWSVPVSYGFGRRTENCSGIAGHPSC